MIQGVIAVVDATLISVLVAVVGLTASGVYGFLRIKGDTREAIERSSDQRIDDMRRTADHWRENYEASLIEAKEQREQKHKALNELAALRLATDLTSLRKDLARRFDAFDKRMEAVEEIQRETVQALHQFEESQKLHASALEAIVKRLNGK